MLVERKVLLASAALFVVILFLAVFVSHDVVLSTNLIFVGMLALIFPYSFVKFFEFKKFRQYERGLPNFLRDIADAQRAELTILQAFQAVSKNDYGPLSNELRKMNTQLSWNIPLEKVLKDFEKRMKKSPTIVKAIQIIGQTNKSGGNIADTMQSLATSVEMIKEVQEEKSALLNQQVILMYAIFFIFLGITIALLKFLIPVLQTQFSGVESLGVVEGLSANPCAPCGGIDDPSCLGCGIFHGISTGFDFGKPEEPQAYYRALFFSMIIVQGLFSGLIVGQISSDSMAAGIKHSFIMAFSGFFIYIFIVKTGVV